VLRGAGGYGKTTLARALAHDDEIMDAYFDGVLWVELGESPGNLLSLISDLIEILSGERPGLENVNIAATKLGEALGDRRILLVIDDVWREQHLRPFLQSGPRTTRLITTRNDHVLPAKSARQPVDGMQKSEALERAQDASAALRLFVRHPKKTFATISATCRRAPRPQVCTRWCRRKSSKRSLKKYIRRPCRDRAIEF
jgi:predicted ATPase